MKKYECLYIVNMNYDSEGVSAVTARVEEVLKNVGGKLANSQHWGKRKLAYAIDKERYGNYVLLHFEGENPNVAEFHRELEIESGVLHYMTIRLDDFPDFETLSVPQAYETDRRSSSAPSHSRPRRYEQDEPEARVDEAPVADEAVADVAEAAEPEAVTEEVVEAAEPEAVEAPEEPEVVETTEETEVVETAEEPEVIEAAEEATPAEEPVEESAEEADEEEAEKPANAE